MRAALSLAFALCMVGGASAGVPLGDQAAFMPRSLINVFNLGGPVTNNGQAASATYISDPYTTSAWGSPSSHITPAVAAQVKAAGFDGVRLQISVGPCVQVYKAGGSQTTLDAAIDGEVSTFLNAGVGVLLSPYLSSYVPGVDYWSTYTLGLGTADYQALRWCVAHEAAIEAYRDPRMVAIDMPNEPVMSGAAAGVTWAVMQADLYAAVQAVAPNMTVVLTAENYSGLLELSGGSYSAATDPTKGLIPTGYRNVLWTFHYFGPSPFAVQGAIYQTYHCFNFMTGVTFPPKASEKAAAITAVTANVNATTPSDGSCTTANAAQELGYYYDGNQGGVYISGLFDKVSAWASYWGISSGDILLGEDNAVRQVWTDQAGRPQGADRLSRANYEAALTSAAAAHGFRHAPDHLDTYDLGITTAAGAAIGPFDPLHITALAPALTQLRRVN